MRDTPADLSGTPQDGGGYVAAQPSMPMQMGQAGIDDELALSYAQATFRASTDFMQNSVRTQWERNIRLVQSRHPSDSKYLSDDYKGRTRLFQPKTRSALLKGEAAVAQAFFSTQDVVSVRPQNDDDDMQRASAALWNEALNYRLTKKVPWFATCVGAYQDASTYGICASKQYWRYEERGKKPSVQIDQTTGMPSIVMVPEVVIDNLAIDIYPPENFRFDPSSDYRDIVNTSPYLIAITATPAGRVKNMVKQQQESGKSGTVRWREPDESDFGMARVTSTNAVEVQRQGSRQTPDQATRNVADHELVWLREYIVEHGGEDYHFYTLGDMFLLSDPVPLKQVYRHGIRPFQVGTVMIETHKTYPQSKVEVTQDVQIAINDAVNLRLDNAKLSLNPKPKVVAGRGVNLAAVRRHWPGEPILVASPDDVTWERPPDVSSSAYLEQDRLNVAFDELQGSFSQSSVATNRNLNETVGGMNLLNAAAGQVGEYQIRTFAETWVEPVMRQLLLLEQHYETDETIFALASRRAKLVQKFGIDQLTDELLMQELTVSISIGIGSTDPMQQLQKLMGAMQAFSGILTTVVSIYGPQAGQSEAIVEFGKEIFGKSGYKDGERFLRFTVPSQDTAEQQNPMAAMQQQMQAQYEQQMQEIQAQMQEMQRQLQDKTADRQMQAQFKSAEMQQNSAIQMEKMQHEERISQAELALKAREIEANIEIKRFAAQQAALAKAQPSAAVKVQYDAQEGIDKLVSGIEASQQTTAQHNQAVATAMARVAEMMTQGQRRQEEAEQRILEQVTEAVGAVAEAVNTLALPKRVVRGKDGKATGVETVRTLQ